MCVYIAYGAFLQSFRKVFKALEYEKRVHVLCVQSCHPYAHGTALSRDMQSCCRVCFYAELAQCQEAWEGGARVAGEGVCNKWEVTNKHS